MLRRAGESGVSGSASRRVLFTARQRPHQNLDERRRSSRLYVAERNRLRAERRAKQADAPRELASINTRSKQILELLLNGFRDEAWKLELHQIEQRRTELEAVIAAGKAEPPPPARHPNMARVFEQKIEQLAAALEHENAEFRETARQALRGFIDRIVIPPGDELLPVVGDLGSMLTAASGREGSALAAVGNGGCGGPQHAEFGVLLGSGVVKSASFCVATHVPNEAGSSWWYPRV